MKTVYLEYFHVCCTLPCADGVSLTAASKRRLLLGEDPTEYSRWLEQYPTPHEMTGNIGMVQCGAPKIAKLVNITPITMIYGTYNYS